MPTAMDRHTEARNKAHMSQELSFYKGSVNVTDKSDATSTERSSILRVKKDLGDVLKSKNLAFLLGSGCSSAWRDGKEVGIPTMGPMAKALFFPDDGDSLITEAQRLQAKNLLGLDLTAQRFSSNLEALMEVLFGFRFALGSSDKPEFVEALELVTDLIRSIAEHVRASCMTGAFSEQADSEPDTTVVETYQSFYRKLIQRDRTLPRPWVFTTNYDLFNETAMDRLGIPYINGFQGSVERRFNPAVFRQTIAEELDLAGRRWSSIDSLVYFAKLHGSISWESRQSGLFPVVETHPELLKTESLLIYPTPAKQNASFASPYSDMFREFQTRVVREQSALVTAGYSFSDEHVNNIIFQALTIPTFRLIAFVDPNANDAIKKLRRLNDPRIWVIGTEDAKADWKGHYFNNIVDDLMPAEAPDEAQNAIENILENLVRQDSSDPNRSWS
jgi:hypothetical protein